MDTRMIEDPSGPLPTLDSIARDLASLGVERGDLLLVHTSFRAVRGPSTASLAPADLIDALQDAIGPDGTLVMPTMTDGETPFDPATTPSSEMGIVAETFWRRPGVLRSTHPGGSFAAIGPLASEICAPQPLAPPHGPDSPPGRVVARDGRVLLLGVGHSESTVMHVAEAIAGVPYALVYPAMMLVDGVPTEVMIPESDSCCRGFTTADAWLRAAGAQREGLVGRAPSRLFRARDAVDAAVARLRDDTLLFLCAPSTCEECDAARASVTS